MSSLSQSGDLLAAAVRHRAGITGRQFAIRQELKVLAASIKDEALFGECRERFLREAQALVLLTRVAGAGDGIVRVQTYF